MDELLKQLLNRLDAIGSDNGEIFDSECRDLMSDAVFDGFIRQKNGYMLPDDFGLQSPNANNSVRNALSEYVNSARALAPTLAIMTFHGRLSAFQNGAVKSDEGTYFDDFFGYSTPEAFDDLGNLIPSE